MAEQARRQFSTLSKFKQVKAAPTDIDRRSCGPTELAPRLWWNLKVILSMPRGSIRLNFKCINRCLERIPAFELDNNGLRPRNAGGQKKSVLLVSSISAQRKINTDDNPNTAPSSLENSETKNQKVNEKLLRALEAIEQIEPKITFEYPGIHASEYPKETDNSIIDAICHRVHQGADQVRRRAKAFDLVPATRLFNELLEKQLECLSKFTPDPLEGQQKFATQWTNSMSRLSMAVSVLSSQLIRSGCRKSMFDLVDILIRFGRKLERHSESRSYSKCLAIQLKPYHLFENVLKQLCAVGSQSFLVSEVLYEVYNQSNTLVKKLSHKTLRAFLVHLQEHSQYICAVNWARVIPKEVYDKPTTRSIFISVSRLSTANLSTFSGERAVSPRSNASIDVLQRWIDEILKLLTQRGFDIDADILNNHLSAKLNLQRMCNDTQKPKTIGDVTKKFSMMGVDPDHVTYSILAKYFFYEGQYDTAYTLLNLVLKQEKEWHKSRKNNDHSIYSIAIKLWSKAGEWDKVKSILHVMKSKGIGISPRVASTLLAYATVPDLSTEISNIIKTYNMESQPFANSGDSNRGDHIASPDQSKHFPLLGKVIYALCCQGDIKAAGQLLEHSAKVASTTHQTNKMGSYGITLTFALNSFLEALTVRNYDSMVDNLFTNENHATTNHLFAQNDSHLEAHNGADKTLYLKNFVYTASRYGIYFNTYTYNIIFMYLYHHYLHDLEFAITKKGAKHPSPQLACALYTLMVAEGVAADTVTAVILVPFLLLCSRPTDARLLWHQSPTNSSHHISQDTTRGIIINISKTMKFSHKQQLQLHQILE
ncbi:hypothetical protein H4219_000235 [Mycoemilia scoparia]|uniref:Pentacotripeptide-repeat region of PRORP domain-containing protein n=1 Tax=Mycoemilia scoparia TaxID=417184 RepID=A0A9W8A3A7_9FUNG|nr:hypothetical protein H4219_000235 [Mycoemilia scoparia]